MILKKIEEIFKDLLITKIDEEVKKWLANAKIFEFVNERFQYYTKQHINELICDRLDQLKTANE